MKKILVIAFLVVFSASAHAQFDWAEGLNDFFADFGRPNCANEGEIADKICCTGLHEQYSGYLGETICTEHYETQITQQSAQNTPTQISYPESEPVCYDDSYCQYAKSEGWKCDLVSNRCYSVGSSINPIAYYPIDEQNVQIPDKTIETEEQGLKNIIPVSYVETKSTLPLNRQKIHIKSPDIVFLPLNYNTGEDKQFQEEAMSQLDFFKKISPYSCQSLSKIAFLEAGKCSVSCSNSCCFHSTISCAIQNNYLFAKRIVGVIKSDNFQYSESVFHSKGGGCAFSFSPYMTSRVVNIVSKKSGYLVEELHLKLLAHELGHSFNLCHVYPTDPDKEEFACFNPGDACGFLCPNSADCISGVSNPTVDVMAYCGRVERYGPTGYNYIDVQCKKLLKQNTQKSMAVFTIFTKDNNIRFQSVHIGEADIEDDSSGSYRLVALDENKVLNSKNFDISFYLHEDVVNENGELHEEPIELNEVPVLLTIPYSPEIDKIKIEHNGQVLVAKDLSEIAGDGNMFAQTSEGNTQITALPEDIAEKQGIKTIHVAYEEKEGNLVYNIEGKKTELFLGFIPIDEHVTATYDSTGNLLNYHQKPWWEFWV